MFTIQFIDYENGSAATWQDVSLVPYPTRAYAQRVLDMMKSKYDSDESLVAYRIVALEDNHSQPTDKGEY